MPADDQLSLEPYGLSQTKRLTVPAAEEILFQPVTCLDHGFVRLVDYMGGDPSIVQSARVSYGAGTKKVSEDRGLIRYLMRHRHTTPFEMVEAKFHAAMPIFVARQWIRHRTANVNEYSGRYSEMPDRFYIPEVSNVRRQSAGNKQGSQGLVELATAEEFTRWLTDLSRDTHEKYLDSAKKGVAREQARMGLPQNLYTEWYWKIDLHNLLHFLSLRKDPHAQQEMRVYADAMAEMTKRIAPVAYEAFEDYRLFATSFSRPEKDAVRLIVNDGTPVEQAAAEMFSNLRERIEFIEKWNALVSP